jgi:hypothetical protein
LAAAHVGARRLVKELDAEIQDFENIRRFYALDPQGLVEARLAEVANQWQEARVALGQAHLRGIQNHSKSDCEESREKIVMLADEMELCEQRFKRIYDHAKRVFPDISLKERQVEFYVTEKKAA